MSDAVVRSFRFACLAAVGLCGSAMAATTWHVAPTGDDEANDGKSWEQPFASFAKAVASLSSYDTIVIADGVYAFDDMVTIEKENVTVRSQSGDPKDVVFDGQGKTRLVYVDKYATKIYGITFQNAHWDAEGSVSGAALYFRGGSTVLSNCVFRNNFACGTAGTYGGSLYMQSFASSPSKAYDLLFENNALVVTNLANGPYASRGGAACFYYTTVTNSIFRCNVNTNETKQSYYNIAAGGAVYAEASSFLDCDIYSNEVVNVAASTAGYGGGAFLADSASSMRNCRVWCNAASNAGGGVSVWGSLVEDCVISNNEERATYYSGSGNCGGGVVMNGGELSHCHVVSNRLVGSVSYCGGGSGVCAKNGAFVHDCLIERNSGNQGVLGCTGAGNESGEPTVFSNCVIRCNVANSDGMLLTAHNGARTLVTDCWITDNAGPDLTDFTVQWGDGATHEFRNLYICSNRLTSAWSAFVYSSCDTGYVSTQRFENCTFVNNIQANNQSGPFAKNRTDGTWGQAGNMIFFDRCAVVNCCGNWLYDSSGTGDPFGTSQDANCCLLPSIPASMADCHNLKATGTDAVDPKFVDAGNGDFRLQASSPLVDAGGLAQDWMGSGRRSGPRDMGDGTYTIGTSGKYGVTISRNNANPRLYGGVPDIGCCEFYMPPGLMLFFR